MRTLYKFGKGLIVLTLIVVGACFALTKTHVDCGDLQKYVDAVVNFFSPGVKTGQGGETGKEGKTGKEGTSTPRTPEELIKAISERKTLLLGELEKANKSVDNVAEKIDEWRKEIVSGEDFTDRLYASIEEDDFPTKVLNQTFDSKEDVKSALESVLSQLDARQKSVDTMKKLLRESEQNRDALKKQIAELEENLVKLQTTVARHEREGREEFNVEDVIQKLEEGDDDRGVSGAPDLSTLTVQLAKEEEKIKKAGENKLEEEQREKQFEEYYLQYQNRLKARTKKSETKKRSEFEDE